ncbi:MAG: DsrE/DsrF/DrsH-like family protein [Candidatus Aminicenantes bacterium]|nr:MAG: DsrE/DsrF/DrsH-like family protein [Candidatus Aminicenantes bacterium]
MKEEKRKKLSMVIFSGDMDKLFAAFTIATGAAASNMEVTMFFTFWGLRALKKKVRTGKSILGRLLGLFYGGDINRAAPSKMSFGGIGRWMFKKMMKAKRVPTLAELRQMAIDLGVKLFGCQMSMEIMEIPKEKMIDQVAQCVGVATYIEQAQQADVTLFI